MIKLLKFNYRKNLLILIPVILIIIMIIIGIIYYFNSKSSVKSNFSDINNHNRNIKYLTKEETEDFIRKDSDNYINNLSIYDLRARKVSSNEEYKDKVINGCMDFTEGQKEKLEKSSMRAQAFFNNNERWTFALINNNYEDGFPHTREKIIFLSPNVINYEDNELTKTLIHESIHIYQRYNKKAIQIYLDNNGFSISRHKPLVSLIRANPDLDGFIYKDKNGIELVAYYNNENPKGINDISLKNHLYEHPYEKMAYEIADEYYKSVLQKYKNV